MNFPMLDEKIIRDNASAESFRRGKDYFGEGAVLSLTRRGNQLFAEVQGSGYDPYIVTVEMADDEILYAGCTCPYDQGGWCKHIVATLLACREEPETVVERQPIANLLADLNTAQLRSLIETVIEQWPDTLDFIERWVGTSAASSSNQTAVALPRPAVTLTVDLATIRRQVQALASRGVDGIDDYLTQITQLLNSGQAEDAMAVLQAVSEEVIGSIDEDEPHSSQGSYRGDYYDYDDDAGSEYYSLLESLGTLWAEVLLSVDLPPEEREEYQDMLSGWDEELAAIDWLSADDFFSLGVAALEYYWDYPPLQRALAGEITELGAWEAEAPANADELAVIRLRVLERQGRLQEYLHLAEAESQTPLYVNMLAKVGRTDEAVAEALHYLSNAASAQMVAQTLYNAGQSQAAFQVAEHGLASEGHTKYELAIWLQERAVAAGETALALRAGSAAVLERRQLSDYLALQKLAADGWLPLREELLGKLRQRPTGLGVNAIAIFLHEKLIDDAIAALSPYASSGDTMAVMEAARQNRPDWVIQTAQKQADSIMNAGKADQYSDAVAWLQHAKAAYTAHKRQNEWAAYLAQIREKHGRKYKLMGLLKGM